ncbi:hypothetical protein FQN54_002605 [Arachnomyces sp. PD_36]|nr:hypothetical protein FQN54_002605 [Arachnomyces sp. PD_36]
MSKPHASNSEFFTSLTKLLSTQSEKSQGSIFLTQKRFPSSTEQKPDNETQSEPSILVRATDGKDKEHRVKISTVVAPDELEAFYTKYAEVCKAGMVGMKKRDRSGRKKGKGKVKGKGGAGKVTKP